MGMEVAADLVMGIMDMVEDLEVSSLFSWWLFFFFSHSETIAKVISLALRTMHSCWLVLNLYMVNCMVSSWTSMPFSLEYSSVS